MDICAYKFFRRLRIRVEVFFNRNFQKFSSTFGKKSKTSGLPKGYPEFGKASLKGPSIYIPGDDTELTIPRHAAEYSSGEVMKSAHRSTYLENWSSPDGDQSAFRNAWLR